HDDRCSFGRRDDSDLSAHSGCCPARPALPITSDSAANARSVLPQNLPLVFRNESPDSTSRCRGGRLRRAEPPHVPPLRPVPPRPRLPARHPPVSGTTPALRCPTPREPFVTRR